MQPARLTEHSFDGYPPEGRAVATAHLALLGELPVVFASILLRELISYDWKFPAEREELDGQLTYLQALSPGERTKVLAGLKSISVPEQLERTDWVAAPVSFGEQLTAALWATHQMDSFREAANGYAEAWRAARPQRTPALPRLLVVVLDCYAAGSEAPAPAPTPVTFGPPMQKLREHGVLFTKVDPERGMPLLAEFLERRATAYPAPYAHWSITGAGSPTNNPPKNPPKNQTVTSLSYAGLAPARRALLRRVEAAVASGGMGPEALRTLLAQTTPEDLGFPANGSPLVDRFAVSLLTEGSGTQIFSTSFVQWAARETLRRAQPSTLLVHFTARQSQRSLNEMLAPSSVDAQPLDSLGSEVDAEMGAYYTWINGQRLPGAEHTSFVAWHPSSGQAIGIGPSLPRGTVSEAPARLSQVLDWSS